ncbi:MULTISPECIES: RES domain-containing protein [unclassified Microbacterium]|uniref:RES domain-containing protein n=1 Tax=unclassified Microbacterium TaxID=2609290 RepID=UPI0015E34935|nr:MULTISPECIES: RES domain-containing protein [unclassified Microbacterium]
MGYAPDPWQWAPWQFASDGGRFNGRWDDQNAQFRTLYTSDSLLGCFLELLAPQRPNDTAFLELNEIQDDAALVDTYPDPERGAIGLSWLSGRMFARGRQRGSYAEITTSQGVGYLVDAGVLASLGVSPSEVDVALLKNANRRSVTRTIARHLFDLRDTSSLQPAVDGIAFRSRMGDDIRLWAVFERSDALVSEHITPGPAEAVTEGVPELVNAFLLLGLHWKDAAD